MRKLIGLTAITCFILSPVAAQAATATANFTARITIDGECLVATTNALDFGNAGVLVNNIDETTTFQVQCTNTVPYAVGLSAGNGSGATTTIRKMTAGGSTIDYRMFSDPARTVNWGDSFGADTINGIGNGAPQALTIYGRVVPQTTPVAATYTDVVQITIDY